MHSEVRCDLLYMERQLAPSEFGISIEVYCFVKRTAWKEYEAVMAEMFDHLLVVVWYFDLEIYERNSDTDKVQLNFENQLELLNK